MREGGTRECSGTELSSDAHTGVLRSGSALCGDGETRGSCKHVHIPCAKRSTVALNAHSQQNKHGCLKFGCSSLFFISASEKSEEER